MLDVISFNRAKKAAAAAISGVKKMSIDGNVLVIETNNGEILKMVFPIPKDGVGISDITIDKRGHLIVIYTDHSIADVGELPRGKDGNGISDIVLNQDKHLIFTMDDGTKHDAGELPVTIEDKYGYYDDIAKAKDYLYIVHYNALDYHYALNYYKRGGDFSIGGCSSIRNGNWYGRNLDWMYGERAEFVVYVPQIGLRNGSIGVAGGLSALTDSFVKSGEYSSLYKIVPFQMYDGVNEHGVFANMNVVPLDKGSNVTQPLGDTVDEICATMLVRYILDYFAAAKTAVEFIRDHVKVYFPEALHEMEYELHFMVGDEKNTYILEFVDNRTVIIDVSESSNSILAGKQYITNFYMDQVVLNSDGKVYTPETQTETENAIDTNKITPRGSGLERYNYIVEDYWKGSDKDGMRQILDNLKFTRTYSTSPSFASPIWYTEYVGNLKVNSKPEEFVPLIQYWGEKFADRSRATEETWQTVHSSVYDIKERKLYLVTQEDGKELTFSLNIVFATEEWVKEYIDDNNIKTEWVEID